MKEKKAERQKLFLLCLSISFVGWLWETVYVSILAGKPVDRGFLFSPICPIYGLGITVTYLLLGTPREGKGLLKNVKNKFVLVCLYFLLAMLIPSAMELVAGWFFDKAFGLELWTYAHHKYNLGGYISLYMALFWGVALTVIMGLFFPTIYRIFSRIPDKTADILSKALAVLLAIDIALRVTTLLIS